jgi:outer membrane receptor protein involved in Fe transport
MEQLTAVVSRIGSAILLSVTVLFSAAAVHAQQLDEIVVTARKVTENLQEVPLAITAVGSEEIDRLGVRDLDSLSQQDTSVQFDEGFNPSDTRITIRGLSPTRGRPNAATLIDGIDITSEAVSNAGGSLLIDPRLIDVERIEIVKGPQSALYGRSAFAGAIQYVSKDPEDYLGGEIFVDANHEGDKQLRGNVSIPLTDVLGVRFNGLAYDNDGYYRNVATGDYVGGGKGLGGTATVVFDPVDEVRIKWRTDLSKTEADPPAQALLHDLNTLYDLGTSGGLDPSVSGLAPQTSNCTGGFLDNYDCPETQWFKALLDDPSIDPAYEAFGAPGIGTYDPTDDENRNSFNKQAIAIFNGTVPDADDLQVRLSPDYRMVADGNELAARDYKGTELNVFRTSLVAEWDYSDSLVLTSYSSFTDASDDTQIDLGKWFEDECRPVGDGDPAFAAQECGPNLGDGINDLPGAFMQDSVTYTEQVSQEFRAAWDINDDVRLTSGLLYWRERVKEDQYNLTLFTGGPVCYLFIPDTVNAPDTFVDASLNPVSAGFLGLTPEQHLCGNSWIPAAYWANDVFKARIDQPTQLRREVDHFSWYGSLEWNFTDRFKTTLEWRFAKEDNAVIGPQQSRCLPFETSRIATAEDAERLDGVSPGQVICGPDNTGARSAAQTGPSAVILCGQVGRCENLALSPGGNSWWDYGLLPQEGLTARLDRSDRTWAPKVTFEYMFTDDVNGYFSWSRGIKPGGFSLLTLGAFGLDANNDGDFGEISFEPERLDVWELGIKSELWGGRARINGSVYFQDFKAKQVTVQEVVGQQIGTRVENIDGSEIYGFEIDGTIQATDNLQLQVGYTFTDSEYTAYTPLSRSPNDILRVELGNGQGCAELTTFADGSPACQQSYNGNELERAPKHAFLLNANYTNSLFDTGTEWYVEANYRYQSSRWLEQYNITKFPSYERINVSTGILADRWDLQLYIQNLLDDDTPIAGGANPGLVTGIFPFGFLGGVFPPGVNAGPILPSDIYVNMPDPRLIGLRLRFNFGE